jgi:hypothetical protein
MSWINAFASFAVLAIVIGVVCGTGQAFAMPSDSGVGHSAFGKFSTGHVNENSKAFRYDWVPAQMRNMPQQPVIGNMSREIPPMRLVPTIFPVPDREKKIQLVEGYTDKGTYNAGDRATGTVVLKNTGNITVDDVTVYVSAYRKTPIGYVYVGSKCETLSSLKITPGMVKKLDRQVTIPGKFKKTLLSGDYRLDVTLSTGAIQIGSFTTYITIK